MHVGACLIVGLTWCAGFQVKGFGLQVMAWPGRSELEPGACGGLVADRGGMSSNLVHVGAWLLIGG